MRLDAWDAAFGRQLRRPGSPLAAALCRRLGDADALAALDGRPTRGTSVASVGGRGAWMPCRSSVSLTYRGLRL